MFLVAFLYVYFLSIANADNCCKDFKLFNTALLGSNNGPNPYRPDLGSGSIVSGGVNPRSLAPVNDTIMSEVYKSMGIRSIRPNDEGGAFDISCMFPITSLKDIPPPGTVAEDPRWNWTASDEVFSSLLRGGFVPFLKLASQEWKAPRWTGQAYILPNGGPPTYIIAPEAQPGYCAPWPAIAPILLAIGPELVVTIIRRYNDASMWAEDLLMGGNLSIGPPLEPDTWKNVTGGFVGVELQNEYNMLTCMSDGGDSTTKRNSLEGWQEVCGGEPFTWSGKYWDGTPEQAYESYIAQAIALKTAFTKVLVGGPALGTGPSFGIQGPPDATSPSMTVAGGAAYMWVKNFLRKVKEMNAPLDFFTWHTYNTCPITSTGMVDCSADAFNSNAAIGQRLRDLLLEAGYGSTPMVISEWNAAFGSNPGNAAPGTISGAALLALSIIQMSTTMEKLHVQAGFVVNGVDGPFQPLNTRSFPIGCIPEFGSPPQSGAGPLEMNFTGRWVDACAYGSGPAGTGSINSGSGMGLTYPNGDKKPSGAVYTLMTRFQGLKVFQPSGASLLPKSVVAMGAIADDDGMNLLILLVNGDPGACTSRLPSLSDILGLPSDSRIDIVEAISLKQSIRGLTDVVLPNNVVGAGTMQLQGIEVVEPALIGTTGAALEIPASGILLLNVKLDGEGYCSCPSASPPSPSAAVLTNSLASILTIILLLALPRYH